MGDAERTNKYFEEAAERCGYTGNLHKVHTGDRVSFTDLVDNMMKILEHRLRLKD